MLSQTKENRIKPAAATFRHAVVDRPLFPLLSALHFRQSLGEQLTILVNGSTKHLHKFNRRRSILGFLMPARFDGFHKFRFSKGLVIPPRIDKGSLTSLNVPPNFVVATNVINGVDPS